MAMYSSTKPIFERAESIAVKSQQIVHHFRPYEKNRRCVFFVSINLVFIVHWVLLNELDSVNLFLVIQAIGSVEMIFVVVVWNDYGWGDSNKHLVENDCFLHHFSSYNLFWEWKSLWCSNSSDDSYSYHN